MSSGKWQPSCLGLDVLSMQFSQRKWMFGSVFPGVSTSRLFHNLIAQHPAVRSVQGDVSGLWKSMEFPTNHVSPQSIATEAISTYIETTQSQKGDASQLEAMSHIPLTVLMSPGLDCKAV